MKTWIKYFFVIFLVLAEGYLIVSFVGGNISEKRKLENICETKCAYHAGSFLWEFSGDGASKGFTTKEECFNFCFKKENGLAGLAKRYGTAFLSVIFFNNK